MSVYYVCFFLFLLIRFDGSVHGRLTEATIRTEFKLTTNDTLLSKDVIRIIREKCEEFGKSRYRNVTKGGQVMGQIPIVVPKLDCIQTQSLIVGGVHAQKYEFPHMALLGYGDKVDEISWFCSGTLISENFVLSAAHCTRPNGILNEVKWAAFGFLNRNSLTADKLNKNIFRVIETFNHPDYEESFANHDIALYKLENPITLTPHVRPVCLPTSVDISDRPKQKLTITGWGKTSADEDISDTLLKATVYYIEDNICSRRYANDAKLKNGFDPKTMVCAGNLLQGSDTCGGDSGGPIQLTMANTQCMFTQIGVTSHGTAFCGDQETPAIYTRVSNYLDWIQSVAWP